MKYSFILKDFEGPLDLLLHLIEESKIDIYDVQINSITDQYIAYLEYMEDLSLDITSEFIVMASSLLQMKSNQLLPKKEKLEGDEDDTEEELINKLIEYRKYKEVSKKMKIMGEGHSNRFYKKKEDFSYLLEDELALKNISLNELGKAFEKIIKRNQGKSKRDEIDFKNINREEYPIEDSIIKLKEILDSNKAVNFEEVFEIGSPISEIISLFLSILELAKIQYIVIEQEDNFKNIILKKVGE